MALGRDFCKSRVNAPRYRFKLLGFFANDVIISNYDIYERTLSLAQLARSSNIGLLYEIHIKITSLIESGF